jgi:hypothetical protein
MSQAETFSSVVDKQLSKWLGAIPLLIPIFEKLNVVEILNRYCPCEADIDSGSVALILALNRLMSPRPLYLGPLPTIKAYDEVLMSVSTEELKAHPLSYRPKNQKSDEPERDYGVKTEVTIGDPKTQETVSTQGLVLYSRNKAQLDCQKRETLLNRYQARLSQIQGDLNCRKYKKVDYTRNQIQKAQHQYRSVASLISVQLEGDDGQLTLSFDINEQQLETAKERDGRYLLITNRCLSAEEIIRRFKRQDKVEKCNRTIKGPIRIRPIFLHKQERIESLVFICMLALLVFSILEMNARRAGIEMTATAIFSKFAALCAVYTVFDDGSSLKQVAPLTFFQQQFLHRLRLPEPDIYLQPIKQY